MFISKLKLPLINFYRVKLGLLLVLFLGSIIPIQLSATKKTDSDNKPGLDTSADTTESKGSRLELTPSLKPLEKITRKPETLEPSASAAIAPVLSTVRSKEELAMAKLAEQKALLDAVMRAVNSDSPEELKASLAAGLVSGVDINARHDLYEATPLEWAMDLSKPHTTEIVQQLLTAGAKSTSKYQQTLLNNIMSAITRDNLEQVKAILTIGNFDVNMQDRNGITALEWAARSPKPHANDIIRSLINAGAKPTVRHQQLLLQKLQAAITSDSLGQIQTILASDFDINTKDAHGITALMEAISLAKPHTNDIISQLLTAGANADLPDQDGYTPLMQAVLSNNITLIKLLLDHHVNVDTPNLTGITALMFAAGSSKTDANELVRLLLAAKASVNARDSNGRTALIFAVNALDFQSGPDESTTVGKSAEAIKLLALEQANQVIDIIQQLLAAGADINARDQAGETALYHVTSAANPHAINVIKLLLTAGAEIPEILHNSPMIFAAQVSLTEPTVTINGTEYTLNPELRSLLAEAKNNINAQQISNGQTALHRLYILQSSLNIDSKLIDYLAQKFIDMGIDQTIRDTDGHTFLPYKIKAQKLRYIPAFKYKIDGKEITGGGGLYAPAQKIKTNPKQ